MPDFWDTNPDNVFGAPGEQPDPAPGDREDHPKEVGLSDDRGRLRPPAYVLIALVIAVASILLLIAALLQAPSERHDGIRFADSKGKLPSHTEVQGAPTRTSSRLPGEPPRGLVQARPRLRGV